MRRRKIEVENKFKLELPVEVMAEIVKQTGISNKREACVAVLKYGLTILDHLNNEQCTIMIHTGDEPPTRLVR